MPRGEVVEDDLVGANFQGQADRFGLAGVERRLQHERTRPSLECPRLEPDWKLWQAGCYFSCDGGRDHDLREELLQERELIDLGERDEHARVGYDDCGHESIDAFSAAQSSLVIWK